MNTKLGQTIAHARFALAVVFAGSLPLSATTLDLTTAGSSGFINGGFFQQVPNQSTGTGVIDPFLRIQNNGTQEGFNTSLNNPMPDVKTGTFTRDLLLGDIPVVTLGGISYYQVLLDINQTANNPLLSLNSLQVFLRTGALTSANLYTDLTGGASKVWDLDVGAQGDSTIELNYALNPGSGSGDMFAYLPVTAIGTDLTQNFYLYASFGVPNGTNDGFEEFAVVSNSGETPVPTPDTGNSLIAFGAALLLVGYARNRLIA